MERPLRFLPMGFYSRGFGQQVLSYVGDAPAFTDPSDVGEGDIIVSTALASWYRKVPVAALEAARRRGAKVLHWQLEPVLPAFDDPAVQAIALNAARQPLAPHWWMATRDVLTQEILRARSRNENWATSSVSARAFGFALQQTRAVRAFKQSVFDYVMTSVPSRADSLGAYGVKAGALPVCALPGYGRDLGTTERDLDVLFIGRVNSRRKSLLPTLKAELEARGRSVRIEDDCRGEERTRLLNRTRIVINIHKFPWDFPGMRLLMAGLCGALVVSETAPDMRPFSPGVDFAPTSLDRMVDTVLYYLDHEEDRREMASNARRLMTGLLAPENFRARLVAELGRLENAPA